MVKLSQGEHHGVKLAYNLAAAWCHHGRRRQLIWGCQGDQSEFYRCCCTKYLYSCYFFKYPKYRLFCQCNKMINLNLGQCITHGISTIKEGSNVVMVQPRSMVRPRLRYLHLVRQKSQEIEPHVPW
uniref:Uncharacterized protein n=1 Tax=Triticum urartu TaxID=4572 RepID=A0A8R7QS07_TRIUA